MRKSIVILIFMIAGVMAYAQRQCQLIGTVSDRDTEERLSMAKIVLLKHGVIITGGFSDMNGEFSFKNLAEGKYDARIERLGCQTKSIEGVKVQLERPTHLELKMVADNYGPPGLFITYKPKLVDIGDMTNGHIFRSKEIKRSPFR